MRSRVQIRGTGSRGWTFDLGIPEIVRPYVAREVFDDYLALRFGGEAAAERWRGGLLYYRGITGESAKRLLDVLPEPELLSRQNDSPTVGTFLRAAARFPGEVQLIGYLVGPDRPDERFAVEGMHLVPDPARAIDLFVQTAEWWDEPEHEDRCQCQELWNVVQETFGVDDALTFPTQMGDLGSMWQSQHQPGWRLWWT